MGGSNRLGRQTLLTTTCPPAANSRSPLPRISGEPMWRQDTEARHRVTQGPPSQASPANSRACPPTPACRESTVKPCPEWHGSAPERDAGGQAGKLWGRHFAPANESAPGLPRLDPNIISSGRASEVPSTRGFHGTLAFI
jgi:hypothetical protein